jgi:spore coat polysaccharide biosynthesis predicted glycosyltransferase SpsG
VVLNQNLHADEQPYLSREPYTDLLLGTRFALLRDEFLKEQSWRRNIPPLGNKILVTLGGSDPANVTGEVMELLSTMQTAEITIVVGGSNPHLDLLRQRAADLSRPMKVAADAYNMPELMRWADIVVAAGGTTSWELAFTGLPSIIVTLADNQVDISHALDRAGVGISIGKWDGEGKRRLMLELAPLMEDSSRREQMSKKGRQLVDGRGRERVLKTMAERSTGNARLRGLCL